MCIEFQTDLQNKILENLLIHTKFSPETMKHNLRYFQKRGASLEGENKRCGDTEAYFSDLTKINKSDF